MRLKGRYHTHIQEATRDTFSSASNDTNNLAIRLQQAIHAAIDIHAPKLMGIRIIFLMYCISSCSKWFRIHCILSNPNCPRSTFSQYTSSEHKSENCEAEETAVKVEHNILLCIYCQTYCSAKANDLLKGKFIVHPPCTWKGQLCKDKINSSTPHLILWQLFSSALHLGLCKYIITHALHAVLAGKSANINAKLSHCSTITTAQAGKQWYQPNRTRSNEDDVPGWGQANGRPEPRFDAKQNHRGLQLVLHRHDLVYCGSLAPSDTLAAGAPLCLLPGPNPATRPSTPPAATMHTAWDWKWRPPWNKGKALSPLGGLVACLVVDLRARILGCRGAQDADPEGLLTICVPSSYSLMAAASSVVVGISLVS